MKKVDFHIQIGMFTFNPKIRVYLDGRVIEEITSTIPTLVDDIYTLSQGQYNVQSINLYGVPDYLTKFYTQLNNKFSMCNIKINMMDTRKES